MDDIKMLAEYSSLGDFEQLRVVLADRKYVFDAPDKNTLLSRLSMCYIMSSYHPPY